MAGHEIAIVRIGENVVDKGVVVNETIQRIINSTYVNNTYVTVYNADITNNSFVYYQYITPILAFIVGALIIYVAYSYRKKNE